MRKIERQMIEAIHFDRGMTSGNTAIIHGPDDTWLVSLHGHTIARGRGPRLEGINLCGWDTVTTRSRLRALMYEFGRNRLFRHKGQTWYTTDPANWTAAYRMPLTGWVDFTDRASWDAKGAPV